MQNATRYLGWLNENGPDSGVVHAGIRGGFAGGFAGDSQGVRLLLRGIRLETNALGPRFGGIRSRPLKPFIILKKENGWSSTKTHMF